MGTPAGALYQRFGQRRLSALNQAAWLMGCFGFRQSGCMPAGRLADCENVPPVRQWWERGLFKVGEQAFAFSGGGKWNGAAVCLVVGGGAVTLPGKVHPSARPDDGRPCLSDAAETARMEWVARLSFKADGFSVCLFLCPEIVSRGNGPRIPSKQEAESPLTALCRQPQAEKKEVSLLRYLQNSVKRYGYRRKCNTLIRRMQIRPA